jgi:outer membrane protein OmpA-like peptidoglycan-associated protein
MRNRKRSSGMALALAAAVALAGCGPLHDNKTCRIASAVTGGVLGAVGGGVGTDQIGKNPSNGEIAGGAAVGYAAGTIVGALLGYALCPEEAPPAPPPPPPPTPHKVATLEGPQFDFNKATLRPDGRAKVRAAADTLRSTSERVMVTGYTDSIGSDAYNLRLSERRADTVRDALVADGIAASRITTKGMGKANPVASNDTAEGRARNRRVEIEAQ